jgi:transposase
VCELAGRGVEVHRSSVGRFLGQLGLSHKKKPAGQRMRAH